MIRNDTIPVSSGSFLTRMITAQASPKEDGDLIDCAVISTHYLTVALQSATQTGIIPVVTATNVTARRYLVLVALKTVLTTEK